MFTKRQSAVITVAAVGTVVFAVAVMVAQIKRINEGQDQQPQGQTEAQDAGPYWKAPEFELTNQDGKAMGLEDMKGKVWLADFIYTTCPGQCPLITAHVARLQGKLPPAVRIVSFSTDPVTDTPAVLKAYGEKAGASERWTFLTGPKERMYDLIKNGFKLAIDAPPGAQIIHSTKLMLVDKTGMVRGFYEGITNDADETIVEDAGKLLKE